MRKTNSDTYHQTGDLAGKHYMIDSRYWEYTKEYNLLTYFGKTSPFRNQTKT